MPPRSAQSLREQLFGEFGGCWNSFNASWLKSGQSRGVTDCRSHIVAPLADLANRKFTQCPLALAAGIASARKISSGVKNFQSVSP